jgi:serine/threonine-protein kinase
MSESDVTAITNGVAARELVLEAGRVVGDHVIERKLGSGGCADVYAARHQRTGRRVALKLLQQDLASDAELVERFAREVRTADLIRHPHIVEVYETGLLKLPTLQVSLPYFTMELLEGTSLRGLVAKQGRCAPGEVLSLLEPLCGALEAAHQVGVVHRDIKLENIFVAGGPQGRVVKLLDFGIAKLLYPDPNAPSLTTAGTQLGTPGYMAPEQILGKSIDARTDIYALGVVLYHLLTGTPLFQSTSRAGLMKAHLTITPPPPSSRVPLSPELDAVVLRCLEKNPEARFPSADELLRELRAAIGAEQGRTVALQETVALYVAGDYAGASEDELERALDDLAQVLDSSAAALRAHGLAVTLQTGSSQLGLAVLPPGAKEREDTLRRTLRFAVQLYEQLQALVRDGPVKLEVCVHCAQAEIHDTPSGVELSGGPMAQLNEWLRRGPPGAAWMTAEVTRNVLPTPSATDVISIPNELS